MRLRPCVSAVVLLAALAPSAAQEATISYKSTEVVPGLYMLEGEGGFAGGNIGLLDGEDGAVLIDDGLPPLTDVLLSAIMKLTRRPVEFVINTHVHGDHVGGNEAFHERGATIVAHDTNRRRMVDGEDPVPPAALAEVTFSDSVTFHLNGHEAYVFHVPNAHTDGDAVIHFRDANVIHAGDVMFNRLFPYVDIDSGGSIEGYIAAQKRILALADEKTKIIPGHGAMANAADLRASIAMLEDGVAKVGALIAAGKTVEQIVEANPLAPYHDTWSWSFITTERMTRAMYRGLNSN